MLLLVGLGNPGKEYQHTRHNVGFLAVDAIRDARCVDWGLSSWSEQRKTKALSCSGRVGKTKVVLAKPQTFMNLSGEAVRALTDWYDAIPAEIVIIHDEVDLPRGEIRLQFERGAAGHNGIRSIIDHLGTKAFWRLRVGIGKHPKIPTEKYVLGHMNPLERITLKRILQKLPQHIEEQFLS